MIWRSPPSCGRFCPCPWAGAVLLVLFCLISGKTPITCASAEEPRIHRRDACIYAVLFLVAALAVFDLLDYRIVFALSIATMLVKGRNLAQQVDVALLLTFVGFFLFVGNLAHVPQIAEALKNLVQPRPFLAAVLASQIISNVPAAVLLSGFTDDASALLAGVSAGGCGTLIASMASLISYKLFIRSGGKRNRYLVVFTLLNILFLAAMSVAHLWNH